MFSRPIFLILAGITVSAIVRVIGLTDSCLWFDEIFSVQSAELGWIDLIEFVAEDIVHPPLFYLVLKLWMAIGGDGLLWLRLCSVLLATFAIVPLVFLGFELKLSQLSIAVATVFYAVNGALIKYSQEVRMYGLLLLLSTTSTWLFSRYYFRGKSFYSLLAVNLILIYTHYFGWFLILAQLILILSTQRIKFARMIGMISVLVVLFAPWTMYVYRRSESAKIHQNIGWIERPKFEALYQFFFDLIEPFYFQNSSVDSAASYVIVIPLSIVFLACGLTFLFRKRDKTANTAALFLIVFLSIPVFFAVAISWLMPVSVWGSRHLIVVFPAAVVLGSMLVCDQKLGRWRVPVLAISALLILSATFSFYQTERRNDIWCAWESLAAKVSPSDARPVYAVEDLVAYHHWFSRRKEVQTDVRKIEGVPGVVEDRAYFLPRGFDGVKRENIDDLVDESFFLVFRDSVFNEKHPPLDSLRTRGYSFRLVGEIRTDQGKALLVEVVR